MTASSERVDLNWVCSCIHRRIEIIFMLRYTYSNSHNAYFLQWNDPGATVKRQKSSKNGLTFP